MLPYLENAKDPRGRLMPSHPGPPPIEPRAAASTPCGPGPPADHRRGPRRRGQFLVRAIFEATVAELTETGYSRPSMELIIARGHDSNVTLYPRSSNPR